MKRTTLIVGLAVMGLMLLAGATQLQAQQEQPASGQDAQTSEAGEEGDKETHQLPDGYAAVVTKGQRREIYQIQDQYQDQIETLRKQIEAIVAKRDQEVAKVLDDEQKRIIAYILKLRARERAEEEAAAKNGANATDTSTAPSGG